MRLIGVLGPDGRVANLRTPLTIDEDFIEAARSEGPPEARMRFTTACVEGSCAQWTGSSCGIIAKVLEHLGEETLAASQKALPPCGIRGTCRWFSERGDVACHACAYVVTDQASIAAE